MTVLTPPTEPPDDRKRIIAILARYGMGGYGAALAADEIIAVLDAHCSPAPVNPVA